MYVSIYVITINRSYLDDNSRLGNSRWRIYIRGDFWRCNSVCNIHSTITDDYSKEKKKKVTERSPGEEPGLLPFPPIRENNNPYYEERRIAQLVER